MIVPYNETLWSIGKERAAAMPVMNNSHRKASGYQVGALGEAVVETYLRAAEIAFEPIYAKTHDLVIRGYTADVKTKDRTVPPKPSFDCSVPLYNHAHQRPDIYLFVSLHRDKKIEDDMDISRFLAAHLLGWCTMKVLEKEGKVWRKGEVDPSNGTKFWTDCINIPIFKLTPIEKLGSL